MGLDEDQVNVLKRCFDGFADEDGAIPAENVGNILSMMGLKVNFIFFLSFFLSFFFLSLFASFMPIKLKMSTLFHGYIIWIMYLFILTILKHYISFKFLAVKLTL